MLEEKTQEDAGREGYWKQKRKYNIIRSMGSVEYQFIFLISNKNNYHSDMYLSLKKLIKQQH